MHSRAARNERRLRYYCTPTTVGPQKFCVTHGMVQGLGPPAVRDMDRPNLGPLGQYIRKVRNTPTHILPRQTTACHNIGPQVKKSS